ncbi:TetR/AcrR family transcriptional regulator [Myxococcus sp. 1LA]
MTTRTRSSPPRRKDSYHHGDLRRALVDATLALISEEDVSAVSLREVARRAGVSAAAPYHHFQDKSALLAAVAEEAFRSLDARMAEALADKDARPDEQLHRLARCYVRFALEHPSHFRVMYSQTLGDAEKYPELHAAGTSSYRRLLQWAEAAHTALGGTESSETLAITVWAWVHGLASLWNEGSLHKKTGSSSIEPLLERSAALLTRLLAGPTKPQRRSR